jgi:hypothetical protein
MDALVYTSSNAKFNSAKTAIFKAFNLSGRLIVMVKMPASNEVINV